MFDKKGKIASEEIFGMLTFMFAAVIMLVIFYGCGTREEVLEYNELESWKAQVEATKALNFFLEIPYPEDPEKKILDLIVESDIGNMGDPKYLDLIEEAREYFGQLDFLYNPNISWSLDVDRRHVAISAYHMESGESPKAEITIPYMDENLQVREKTVSFDYTP
jgi:hypothetical protein